MTTEIEWQDECLSSQVDCLSVIRIAGKLLKLSGATKFTSCIRNIPICLSYLQCTHTHTCAHECSESVCTLWDETIHNLHWERIMDVSLFPFDLFSPCTGATGVRWCGSASISTRCALALGTQLINSIDSLSGIFYWCILPATTVLLSFLFIIILSVMYCGYCWCGAYAKNTCRDDEHEMAARSSVLMDHKHKIDGADGWIFVVVRNGLSNIWLSSECRTTNINAQNITSWIFLASSWSAERIFTELKLWHFQHNE